MAIGWKLTGTARPWAGRRGRPRRATVLGQDGRPGRPARRRDVRGDVRLPAHHGPQSPARDHDVAASRRSRSCSSSRARSRAISARPRRSSAASSRSAPRAGDSADVTGAILVAGVVLALVGVLIAVVGTRVIYAVLPPVVTGAVVMLIGFNLAPVVADIYWPQDQWVALIVMVAVVVMSVGAARVRRPDRDLPRAWSSAMSCPGSSTGSSARSRPWTPPRRRGHDPLPHQLVRACATPPGSASRRRRSSARTAPRWSAGTCPASASPSSCSSCRP